MRRIRGSRLRLPRSLLCRSAERIAGHTTRHQSPTPGEQKLGFTNRQPVRRQSRKLPNVKRTATKIPLRVQTTRLETFNRERHAWPVSLRRKCSADSGRTWVFTDGGGDGRFGAVVVRPGIEEHRMAGRRGSRTNSVVAELDGVVLGLENCRLGERITIVSDYLWTAYYINGWRRVHHPRLREGVVHARRRLEKLRGAVFVHYALETGGECAFRRWNAVAHDLCQKDMVGTNSRTPWDQTKALDIVSEYPLNRRGHTALSPV